MAEWGNTYEQVLGITRAYLGPTSERFLNRQINQRLQKDPGDLTPDDLPELALVVHQRVLSLTGDSKVADEFKNKLLGIGKESVLQKSLKSVAATDQSDYSNIRERIRWYVELRWLLLVALGLTATLPLLLVNGYQGTVPANIDVLAVGVSINLVFSGLFIRPKYGKKFYLVVAMAQILTDIGIASILLTLNGGIESRTVIMYALPILMSGVLLGTSAVFLAGLLSIITYTTLVLLDYFGVLRPENISNPAVHGNLTYLLRTVSFYPAILLALTIITALVVRVISSKERLELEVKGLGAEKARLGAIVKSMGSAMVTVNTNGEIETVNDAFEDLTGWKQGEVIGRQLDDVLPLLDETGKPVRGAERPMAKLFAAKDLTPVANVQHISQFQYVRKNQSVFPFIGTLAPIVVRGRVIGATTVFDDASDIRQVQTLKSNFIALASHQLKTPVAEIKTITEFMLDGVSGKLNDEQTNYLKEIYGIADHSSKMISDLLDISILEKNKVGLSLNPVKLSAIIEKVETVYQSRVKQKGLELKIIQKEPELVIVADDSKLVEVIGNLISNAINFTSKGTITVETKRDGNFCVIVVTDQGRGMSTAALNHIFKKEETLPGTAIAEAGSGLGLYLSKQLVLLHGGDIGVLSTSKTGTSLYIKIPLAKQTADQASE